MAKTVFTPQSDGFAFANSWTFDATESAVLRSAFTNAISGAIALVNPIFGVAARLFGVADWLATQIATGLPTSYGLCAGMALSALDYYKSGLLAPTGIDASDRPARTSPEGTVLRDYLWRRQLESFANAPAVLAWMAVLHLIPREWPFSGGHPWLRDKSREHWEILKGHIDAGDPWPIVLIGSNKDPFTNHAVLAYGYQDNGDGTGRIYLYDMNCPGQEQTTDVDFRGEMLTAVETCANRQGWTPLRGFFCYDYSAVTPPDIGLVYSGVRREQSRPEVYIVFGGAKFHIPSSGEFDALGLSSSWVRTVPDGMLAGLGQAPRDRSLVKERSRPEVYIIFGGAKFHIPSPEEFDALGLSWSSIRTVSDGALGAVPSIPRDGTILRERSRNEVYLIRGGQKYHVPSPEIFSSLGLSWADIRVVPDGALAVIPDEPLPQEHPDCPGIRASIDEARDEIQSLYDALEGLNPRNTTDRAEINRINGQIAEKRQEIRTLERRRAELGCR